MGRLIVISGLPGRGKTTLARALAHDLRSVYLRVDSVETPLIRAGIDVGPSGYEVVRELAYSNLVLGMQVVVDLVDPIPITRRIWTDLASELDVPLVVLECVVPDAAEHRRRVEARTPDLPGQVVPTWGEVSEREYAPWDEGRAGRRVEIDMTDTDAGIQHARAALASASASASASGAAGERTLISQGSTFERQIGYSRRRGRPVGVGVRDDGVRLHATMTISPDVVEQTEQALRNLEAALREAGASLSDVVRVRYLLPRREDFELCWPVLRSYLGEVRPAATMQVCGLADEAMRVEVEATAYLAGRG